MQSGEHMHRLAILQKTPKTDTETFSEELCVQTRAPRELVRRAFELCVASLGGWLAIATIAGRFGVREVRLVAHDWVTWNGWSETSS